MVTGVAGLRLATTDPASTLERWAAALAIDPVGDVLRIDDGSYVQVDPVGSDGRSGLTGIDLWAAAGQERHEFDLAGVRFRLVPRRSWPGRLDVAGMAVLAAFTAFGQLVG